MDNFIDRDNVEKMIGDFYKLGNISPPSSLTINNDVAEIFFRMIQATQECTGVFVLVPHPPSGPATVKWLAYNLHRTVFEKSSGEISITCVKMVIWKMRSKFDEAIRGI